MDRNIRVAVVDDDPQVHRDISEIIRRSGKPFRLIASFQEPDRAARELPGLRPDILLVDIFLGKHSGVECVRTLAPLLPDTGILMLTVSQSPAHLFESLRVGARGYLVKRNLEDRLISSIESVHRGDSELSPSVARLVVDYLRKERENPEVIEKLTPREEALLRLISHGASNKEAAAEMGIEVPRRFQWMEGNGDFNLVWLDDGRRDVS